MDFNIGDTLLIRKPRPIYFSFWELNLIGKIKWLFGKRIHRKEFEKSLKMAQLALLKSLENRGE